MYFFRRVDTLDHKLSTELTEMKNILINLQRQIEANRGYSSDATHQTKVRINSTSFFSKLETKQRISKTTTLGLKTCELD